MVCAYCSHYSLFFVDYIKNLVVFDKDFSYGCRFRSHFAKSRGAFSTVFILLCLLHCGVYYCHSVHPVMLFYSQMAIAASAINKKRHLSPRSVLPIKHQTFEIS